MADGTDRLEEALDAVEAALTAGDWDGARAAVAALEAAEGEAAVPGAAAAARGLLCTLDGDTAGMLDNVARALRQQPGHPRLLCLLAAGRALGGHAERAEEPALAAVAADDSARSWETLGAVLGAADKWDQAEQAYRKALEREPRRHTALVERARALGRLGLGDAMLDELALALAVAPDDHGPLESVVQALVGDAMAGHRDDDEPPDEEVVLADALELGMRLRAADEERSERAAVLLDLALLRLAAAVTAPDDVVGPTRERVTAAARAGAPDERVALAALLASVAQPDAARALLADLAPEGLPAAVRARAEHALGEAAAVEGRDDEAVARYEAAVGLDGRRWQSACNALQILLAAEAGDPGDRIAALLAAVDDRVRRSHPPLLYNEALHHARAGREDDARALLEAVRRRVGPDHPLAAYTADALDELA